MSNMHMHVSQYLNSEYIYVRNICIATSLPPPNTQHKNMAVIHSYVAIITSMQVFQQILMIKLIPLYHTCINQKTLSI